MDRKLGHGSGTAATSQGRLSLRFTWRAIDDLTRLKAFIAKDNPDAAKRISKALRQSIDHLTDHPYIGYLLDDASDVREWVAGKHVVHYLVGGQAIVILRIWHGREQH